MMRMLALFLGGSVRMPRVFWGNVGRVLFRCWGGQQYPVRPPLRQGLMIMTDDSFKEGCSRLGPLQVQAGVVVMRASQASFGIS